jgi:hypothetical protein
LRSRRKRRQALAAQGFTAGDWQAALNPSAAPSRDCHNGSRAGPSPEAGPCPPFSGNHAPEGLHRRGRRGHRDEATACRVGSQPTREAGAAKRIPKPRMARITRMNEGKVNTSNSCHGCHSWLRTALVPAAGRAGRICGICGSQRGFHPQIAPISADSERAAGTADEPSPAFGRSQERFSHCRVPAERRDNSGGSPIVPLISPDASG